MEDKNKNVDEIAKDVVSTGSGLADAIVNTANKINMEAVIPALSEGIKALSGDEKTKEDVDKFADISKTAANTVAGVFSKVIKTGAEVLNDNVIPAVKDIADTADDKKK